jgi:hypothetical protein
MHAQDYWSNMAGRGPGVHQGLQTDFYDPNVHRAAPTYRPPGRGQVSVVVEDRTRTGRSNTPFPTMEAAAMAAIDDIQMLMEGLSPDSEYGTWVYSCPGGFCYTDIRVGTADEVRGAGKEAIPEHLRMQDYNSGRNSNRLVAHVHSHATNPNNHWAEGFSRGRGYDIDPFNRPTTYEYLLTPKGKIRRYHPFGVFRVRTLRRKW